MSAVAATLQPRLPWTTAEEDRRFRSILVVSLLVFFLVAALVTLMPVSRLEIAADSAPPLRLARIIEQTVTDDSLATDVLRNPAAQLLPPQTGRSVDTARAPVVRKPGRAIPRERAAHSGVLALSETLAELSQAMPKIAVAAQEPVAGGQGGAPLHARGEPSRLTDGITRGSGAIGGKSLPYSALLGASDWQGKAGTSSGGGGTGSGAGVRGAGGPGGAGTGMQGAGGSGTSGSGMTRSREEIQEILERNKPAIYRLYNNALRRNPELQGHVLLSITIAPSGQVTACAILFSELNAAVLEAQLVELVRRFDFGAKPEVSLITTKVPIEFFPL